MGAACFVLNFWINDSSAGFEKTDEAMRKVLTFTFDLFQRSPIDNLFEYGKFLAKTADLKKKWDLVINMTELPFAAIFDMDGTLIDNTPYHFKSWQALFKKIRERRLKQGNLLHGI